MGIEELRQFGVKSMTYAAGSGNQILHTADKDIEVGPMASMEEIKAAIQNPFVPTANTKVTMSTLTGYQPGMIQAKLNELKQKAMERRTAAFGKLDAAHQKLAGVDAEIEKAAAQIDKEADLALHEFAQFSNGAPE